MDDNFFNKFLSMKRLKLSPVFVPFLVFRDLLSKCHESYDLFQIKPLVPNYIVEFIR